MAAEFAALPPRTFEIVKRRLRAGISDSASKSLFGGAELAGWATDEAAEAAATVLGHDR